MSDYKAFLAILNNHISAMPDETMRDAFAALLNEKAIPEFEATNIVTAKPNVEATCQVVLTRGTHKGEVCGAKKCAHKKKATNSDSESETESTKTDVSKTESKTETTKKETSTCQVLLTRGARKGEVCGAKKCAHTKKASTTNSDSESETETTKTDVSKTESKTESSTCQVVLTRGTHKGEVCGAKKCTHKKTSDAIPKSNEKVTPEDDEDACCGQSDGKCDFVIVKGSRKGEVCGAKVKSDSSRCSTHCNSKSAVSKKDTVPLPKEKTRDPEMQKETKKETKKELAKKADVILRVDKRREPALIFHPQTGFVFKSREDIKTIIGCVKVADGGKSTSGPVSELTEADLRDIANMAEYMDGVKADNESVSRILGGKSVEDVLDQVNEDGDDAENDDDLLPN